MVKIKVDKTDSRTCLMCMETKTIHFMRIEYKGGGGCEIAMCADCMNKFAQELYDEMNNIE